MNINNIMDINNTIGTNIVDNTQTLYNYDKEMSNMSYVIMMKCSDGIVCGADSRSTINDGNQIKSAGDVCKVFSNDNIIVGTFGVNQVIISDTINGVTYRTKKKIEEVILQVLQDSESIEKFALNFKNKIENVAKYTFFIGNKNDNDYEIFNLEVSKDNITLVGSDSNILSTIGAEFSYSSCNCNKSIKCEKAEKIIHKMIKNIEEIQDELLEYQTVAGDIVIKTLK